MRGRCLLCLNERKQGNIWFKYHKMLPSPTLCSDLLRQKDTEIMSLLEEKVRLFRGMVEGLNSGEEAGQQVEPYFRSTCNLEVPRGASIMKDALQEGKTGGVSNEHSIRISSFT